ncbi:hypothetical protein BGX23_004033 [Mortierella sp. AD031]|nr:hypothetical protein BGX23_004033 [Mortierella sp. AD031]
MSAITSSAVRMVRAATRQYSAAAVEASVPAAVGQHSTKKLAIASGAAFVVGVDVTYAYFTFGQRKDASA